MSEIVKDFLFLGGFDVALNISFLNSKAISHIVNVAEGDVPTRHSNYGPKFFYHGFDFDDEDEETLIADLTKAFQFIDEARRKNTGVLVHCHYGYSRSPA